MISLLILRCYLMDMNEMIAKQLIGNGEDLVYENDYMIVYKVLKEIPTTNANYVKRVQVVQWKSKKTDTYDLDIRSYSKRENKYKKGITLDPDEFKDLKEIIDALTPNFLENFNSNS